MDDILLSAEALPALAAMAALALLSAFFSASETALFYLSHDDLRRFRLGTPRERQAVALLSDPDRLLTDVLFCNLVADLLYFAVAVTLAARLPAGGGWAGTTLFLAGSLILLILVGEVVPRSLAAVSSRRLAPLTSRPLALAVRAVDPFTSLLRRATRTAGRAFFPHVPHEPNISADDLERAVDATASGEDLARQERQVLHHILDLSEMKAEELMRPRGTYLALPPPLHLSSLHGEVPPGDVVCVIHPGTEDVDRVVTLTDTSSLPGRHLEAHADAVVHVPWCASLAETLQLLRDRYCPAASVVNEYGETMGVVLLDDIIDAVFAPPGSRGRRVLRREPVQQVAADRWLVDGITTVRYLCRRLELDYEPDPESLLTVAGLLHEQLEHIPVVGNEIHWRGHRVIVTEVGKRGRLRAMISKPHEQTAVQPAAGS